MLYSTKRQAIRLDALPSAKNSPPYLPSGVGCRQSPGGDISSVILLPYSSERGQSDVDASTCAYMGPRPAGSGGGRDGLDADDLSNGVVGAVDVPDSGLSCSADTSSLLDPKATLDPQSVSIGSGDSPGASAIDNGNEGGPCHDFSSPPPGQSTYTAQSSESQIVDSSAAATAQLFDNLLSGTPGVQDGAETSNEKVNSRSDASSPFLVHCDQLCSSTAASSRAEVIKSKAKPSSNGAGVLSSSSDGNTFVATFDNTKLEEAQSLGNNKSNIGIAMATEESAQVGVRDSSISTIESMSSSTFKSERRLFVDINMRSTKCIKTISKRGTKSK